MGIRSYAFYNIHTLPMQTVQQVPICTNTSDYTLVLEKLDGHQIICILQCTYCTRVDSIVGANVYQYFRIILLCQKKKLMCTMWTLQWCCFLHLQIGEQQLKSLLERVSEQTAKKTTVKVGPKETQHLYLRKGKAHMHYLKNFVFTIKRGMVTILNKFNFCVFITAIKND